MGINDPGAAPVYRFEISSKMAKLVLIRISKFQYNHSLEGTNTETPFTD